MKAKQLAASIVQEWIDTSPFGDFDDLEKIIARRVTPLLQRWIPVTEQLPDDHKKVLALFREEDLPVIVYLDKRVGKWADDPQTGYYVEWPTHWTPLPTRPGGKEDRRHDFRR